MKNEISRQGLPSDNVCRIVDTQRAGEITAGDAEIGKLSIGPEKSVLSLLTCKERSTHNLSAIVQVADRGACATQGAEIDHFSVFPKESPGRELESPSEELTSRAGIEVQIRGACNLSPFVDPNGQCIRAAQRSQVLHDAILPAVGPGLIKAKYGIRILNRIERQSNHFTGAIYGCR